MLNFFKRIFGLKSEAQKDREAMEFLTDAFSRGPDDETLRNAGMPEDVLKMHRKFERARAESKKWE